METTPKAVMVVMESGSEWPAWIDQCRPCSGPCSASTRVIAQEDGETPHDLAERVVDRAESSQRDGAPIDLAVIACSERVDDAALGARRVAASAILSAMARRRRGRLLLSANRRSSGRARHALSAIAAELSQAWEGTGVLVSVRFGVDVPEPAETDAERHVA